MGRLAASRLKIASPAEIRKFQLAMLSPRKRHVTASHIAILATGALPKARALMPAASMLLAAMQAAGRLHHFISPPEWKPAVIAPVRKTQNSKKAAMRGVPRLARLITAQRVATTAMATAPHRTSRCLRQRLQGVRPQKIGRASCRERVF